MRLGFLSVHLLKLVLAVLSMPFQWLLVAAVLRITGSVNACGVRSVQANQEFHLPFSGLALGSPATAGTQYSALHSTQIQAEKTGR